MLTYAYRGIQGSIATGQKCIRNDLSQPATVPDESTKTFCQIRHAVAVTRLRTFETLSTVSRYSSKVKLFLQSR